MRAPAGLERVAGVCPLVTLGRANAGVAEVSHHERYFAPGQGEDDQHQGAGSRADRGCGRPAEPRDQGSQPGNDDQEPGEQAHESTECRVRTFSTKALDERPRLRSRRFGAAEATGLSKLAVAAPLGITCLACCTCGVGLLRALDLGVDRATAGAGLRVRHRSAYVVALQTLAHMSPLQTSYELGRLNSPQVPRRHNTSHEGFDEGIVRRRRAGIAGRVLTWGVIRSCRSVCQTQAPTAERAARLPPRCASQAVKPACRAGRAR